MHSFTWGKKKCHAQLHGGECTSVEGKRRAKMADGPSLGLVKSRWRPRSASRTTYYQRERFESTTRHHEVAAGDETDVAVERGSAAFNSNFRSPIRSIEAMARQSSLSNNLCHCLKNDTNQHRRVKRWTSSEKICSMRQISRWYAATRIILNIFIF